MAETIDGLQIEIESDATDATRGLDNLAKSLERLKTAVSGSSDTAKGIRSIASAIKSLGKIDNLNLSANITQIKKLNGVISSMQSSDFAKFQSNVGIITSGVQQLSNMKAENLSSVGSGVKSIVNAYSKLGTLNMDFGPQLSSITSAVSNIDMASRSLNRVNFKQFEGNIRSLSTALQPLQGFKTQASSLLNALSGFPESARALNNFSDFDTFGTNIGTLKDKLEPLGQVNSKLGATIDALSRVNQAANSLNSVDFTTFDSQVNSLATALNKLSGVNVRIGSTLNQLSRVGTIATELSTSLKSNDLGGDIDKITSAFGKLGSIGKNNLGSTLNQLNKIPEITKSLDVNTLNDFSSAIDKLIWTIKPLADEMEKVSLGFSALPSRIQSAIRANERLVSSNNRASSSFNGYRNSLTRTITKMTVLGFAIRHVADMFAGMFEESNSYIENLNLFTVTMGDSTDSAMEFANTVSDLMGIDVSQWIENQGVFMRMATGFGIASDQAAVMSQNLTQLAYDMASFFDADVDTAMAKLQSGMSGQIKGLKSWGYNLSVAALQETALSLGIEQSVRTMTEAQRAQLRYITLIQKSYGVMGDMGRTLITPANSLRILQAQFVQLKRALGDVVSVIAVKVIPYVMAMTKILTEAARSLASFLGFELPNIDRSGLELGSDVIDDIGDGLDSATASAKKLNAQLMGFDELNVLKSASDAGSGASAGASYELGIELPTYDFLAEVDKTADDIKQRLEKVLNEYILPIVERVGAAFLTWKVSQGLILGLETVSGLLDKISMNGVGKAGFTIPVLAMLFDDIDKLVEYFNDFLENGPTFDNVTGMISRFAGALGEAFMLLGHVKLGGALEIFSGIVGIVHDIKDIADNGVNVENAIDVVYNLSRIVFGIGVLTNNASMISGSLIGLGLTTIIKEIAENWDAIREGNWDDVDKATLAIGAIEAIGGVVLAIKKVSNIFNEAKSASEAKNAIDAVGVSIGGIGNSIGSVGDTVGQSIGGASPKLATAAKNIGIGVGIVAEVAASAIIFAGAIAILGWELGKVSDAWEPVIDNAGTVAIAVATGTAVIAGVGAAAYGLGTLGGKAALNIGIGTAVLLEIGVAAGLFIAEIWLIGEGLNKVGEAWQPVIDNGETVATGIAIGTAMLVGVGVASAAIGAATVASAGTLPVAIAIGTGVLVELAESFVLFTDSIVAVADELSNNLSPALSRLNRKLPGLENNMSSFVEYMTVFAEDVTSYTDSMGSVTWSSIVNSFTKLFSGNPIKDFADSVSDTEDDVADLNEKLKSANEDLSMAVILLTDYTTLLDTVEGIANSGGKATISSDMFVNFKEAGKSLVTGLVSGIDEYAYKANASMDSLGANMMLSLKNSIEKNKYGVRTSLSEIFSGVKIKLPKFTITGKFDVENNLTPKVNVSWSYYKDGGFPSTGEMFIAREAGPEMVGRIGSKTTVANNDQIVSGIAAGVSDANQELISAAYAVATQIVTAIRENGGDVYLDGDKVTAKVTSTQKQNDRMYG